MQKGQRRCPSPAEPSLFVRRAFNDPASFATGWVLLLDYLVVVALAALFVPHYLGSAFGWDAIARSPWDTVLGVTVIVLLTLLRLVRRARLIPIAIVMTLIALVGQLVVVVLGFVFLFSGEALTKGLDLGVAPTWQNFVFALTISALAYTGLETVSNLAAEVREPGRAIPRGLFTAFGLVVLMSVAIALIGISAYPTHADPGGGFSTDLGTDWLRAPIAGITAALDASLPAWAADTLRVFVGISGAFVLIGAVVTAIAGATRVSYALAQRSMLPRAFARRGRTTAVAGPATVAIGALACVFLVLSDLVGHEVRILSSLYSFGIFLAATAAQLAVLRLRVSEPGLDRPFRVPLSLRIFGRDLPLPALIGIVLTVALWLATLTTHDAARIAGPVWLLIGVAVYATSRRAGREPLLARAEAPVGDIIPEEPEGVHERLLVPLKMGEIGEEVLATAIKLAAERGAAVHIVSVIKVPFKLPLDAPFPEKEAETRTSIDEAREVAAEHKVTVEGDVIRARDIGEAIVGEAARVGADLILMGSHPRWRRSTRFFSPTVDYVLRKAPCEVMVVAYPEGVLQTMPAR